jgi:hypothetical protein
MGVSVSDDIGFFTQEILDRIYRINRMGETHIWNVCTVAERAVLQSLL